MVDHSQRGTIHIYDRPMAFVDVETTGTSPHDSEIIEIGCAIVDPHTLKVITTFERLAAIRNPLCRSEAQLSVNGYNAFTFAEWDSAPQLSDVLTELSNVAAGTVMWGYNVSFDRMFLTDAYTRTGVVSAFDYHVFDIMPIAFEALRGTRLEKFSLDTVSRALGIDPEPLPHRALAGALHELSVYRILRSLWTKH